MNLVKVVKKAFGKTIPVMAGYLVIGTGYGVILGVNSFSFITSFSMSLFIYAGSMQFVAVPMMMSGASFVSVLLTTFMVNARHVFYGISMIEKYKGAGLKKLYMIFSLSDETYSLVCSSDASSKDYHWESFFISLLDQLYWVAGTVIGYLAGSFVSFDASGVDFAMTALFITVFLEQWMSSDTHIPSVSGLLASVICLVAFGKDGFLIPAMCMIVFFLLFFRKRLSRAN